MKKKLGSHQKREIWAGATLNMETSRKSIFLGEESGPWVLAMLDRSRQHSWTDCGSGPSKDWARGPQTTGRYDPTIKVSFSHGWWSTTGQHGAMVARICQPKTKERKKEKY